MGGNTFSFNLETDFSALDEEFEPSELVTAEETDEETEPEAATPKGDWLKVIFGIVAVLLVLLSAGSALLLAQWLINPDMFKQFSDRFLPQQQQNLPEQPPKD